MLENKMINKKSCTKGLIHIGKSKEITLADPKDTRDQKYYQALFKNYFGKDYKNDVAVQGFSKKLSENWTDNKITVNRDDN
jgi:hypothetical protein